MRTSIYLDNNASTHLDPAVAARMSQLYGLPLANPASQHRAGRCALGLLEEAKTTILQQLGVSCEGMDTANIILTSGGTEASNLALYSFSRARPGTVIVGASEHPSVLEAAQHQTLCQNPVLVLPVDRHGQHDLDFLADCLKSSQPVSFVSVMLGNNETGVMGNLHQICQICRLHGVPVHSDVVQSAGKIPFSMTKLGLAAISLSAHKFHGPVGIGALIVRNDLAIQPLIVGGGQQLGHRAGTEPVIPAVGLATALCQSATAIQSGDYERVAALRDHFETAMLDIPETVVIGNQVARLPTTSNIAFVGLDRQALHMALDLAGVACSSGSACASGSSRPSSVLLAMGLPQPVLNSSLRFSFSRFTTNEDVELAIETVHRVAGKLHSIKAKALA